MNEWNLEQKLRELASVLPAEAGEASENILRDAFRRQRRRSLRNRLLLAAAACLALAIGWFAWHGKSIARAPQTAAAEYTMAPASGFVPLAYGQSDMPLEQAVIVSVRVEGDAGPVHADLLVGQDGMARAIRFNQ